jgi:hypothetical protein
MHGRYDASLCDERGNRSSIAQDESDKQKNDTVLKADKSMPGIQQEREVNPMTVADFSLQRSLPSYPHAAKQGSDDKPWQSLRWLMLRHRLSHGSMHEPVNAMALSAGSRHVVWYCLRISRLPGFPGYTVYETECIAGKLLRKKCSTTPLGWRLLTTEYLTCGGLRLALLTKQ